MLSQTQHGIFIDGRGRNGEDGRNGEMIPERGFFSWSSTRDGAAGMDATIPTNGQNGGQITVHLQRGPDQTEQIEKNFKIPKKFDPLPINVQLSGKIVGDHAQYHEFSGVYTLQPNQSITLVANGGNGGSGATGSDGENGFRGYSGSDATSFSNAERGGPGGDGGNAGAGSSGGDAGNGGKVFVQVHERSTNLLMLLGSVSCFPGQPGPPGRHGKPGRGGQGGAGGQGYTSTVHAAVHTPTHHYNRYQHSHYDDNPIGFGVSSTNTRHRPSAPNGPDGRDGEEPKFVPQWGNQGNPGIFRIVMYDDFNQSSEFDGVFKLEFVSCKIQSLSNQSPFHPEYDGIYESEEMLLIQDIIVKNIGQMPTPSFTNIYVYLEENEDIALVQPESSHLCCPFGIAPGAQATIQGSIQLQLILPSNNRCKESKRIPLQLFSFVEGANRGFDKFSREPSIQVPVSEVVQFVSQSMSTSVNLCIGQWKECCIVLQNNSLFNIGYDSALRRSVEVRLNFKGGKIAPRNIFISTEEEPINFVPLGESFMFSISCIYAAPNAQNPTKKIKFWVMVDDVVPYIESDLEFELLLQTLIGGSRKIVQVFPWTIRSTQKYRRSDDASFLLVVNHKNTYEEILSWQEFGARFLQVANIWDADQEGFFSLSRPRSTNAASLGQEWTGKFIVFLCSSSFENPATNPLNMEEFLHWKSSITFYFFAPQGFNFSWLIYWTFPLDYRVLTTTEKNQVVDFLERNKSFGNSIRFKMSKGCFGSCRSTEAYISNLFGEFGKKLLKVPQLANTKFILIYDTLKKDIVVDFIPVMDYPLCHARSFSWLSVQNHSSSVGIHGIPNALQFSLCIPFEGRIKVVIAKLGQWSTGTFVEHDKYLMKSILTDLVHECLHLFRSFPVDSLKNPQHWLDKMDNLLRFLDLDTHLSILYYQKNDFWNCLSECIVQYLTGVKYCAMLIARTISSKSKFKNSFYSCIQAKVLEKLGQFICPEIKESTRQYIDDYVRSTMKSKLDGCGSLESFLHRIVDPLLTTTMQCGSEANLWTTEKEVLISMHMYTHIKEQFGKK